MSSAADFLKALNEQNERIAARAAEREAQKPKPDLARLQKEQERRGKWGQLRAREHLSKRPIQARHVFGKSNLYE